jgi:hypothetical protein
LKRLDIDVLISPAEGIGRMLQLSNYHWLMQVISPMMGVSIQMKVDVAHEGRKSRTKQLKGTNEEEKKKKKKKKKKRKSHDDEVQKLSLPILHRHVTGCDS